MNIGVLALQGDVSEHLSVLKSLGTYCSEVRTGKELVLVDALIIPGGESTTLSKLLSRIGLDKEIIERVKKGMPVFGTCAGLILLARYGLIDVTVERNAYGRQLDSFEAEVRDSRVAFIRAPKITSVDDTVEILSVYDGNVVFCKQKNVLVSSFHPEVFGSGCFHGLFLDMVKEQKFK
jgi:pyridoxal 5'-phosphate synthase pdxT subunit